MSERTIAAIRAAVGITAIAIVMIVAIEAGLDGDIAKWAIGMIGAIAVGAESLAAWIGGKQNGS